MVTVTIKCILNKELLGRGEITSRSTRQIAFSLPEHLAYETGDHVRVQPLNDLKQVQRFVRCFKKELLLLSDSSFTCNVSEEERLHVKLNQPFNLLKYLHEMANEGNS